MTHTGKAEFGPARSLQESLLRALNQSSGYTPTTSFADKTDPPVSISKDTDPATGVVQAQTGPSETTAAQDAVPPETQPVAPDSPGIKLLICFLCHFYLG